MPLRVVPSPTGLCRDQEGRRGSEEAVPGLSVLPSGDPGVSGDFCSFFFFKTLALGRGTPGDSTPQLQTQRREQRALGAFSLTSLSHLPQLFFLSVHCNQKGSFRNPATEIWGAVFAAKRHRLEQQPRKGAGRVQQVGISWKLSEEARCLQLSLVAGLRNCPDTRWKSDGILEAEVLGAGLVPAQSPELAQRAQGGPTLHKTGSTPDSSSKPAVPRPHMPLTGRTVGVCTAPRVQ